MKNPPPTATSACIRCGSTEVLPYRRSRCRDCMNTERRAYYDQRCAEVSAFARARYWKRKGQDGNPRSKTAPCKKCGVLVGLTEKGRRAACDPCRRRSKENARLRAKFGIDLDEYERMEREQGGVCSICGNPNDQNGRRLHVDHCHRTGRVRALLCCLCNTALGKFQDDPRRLQAAIRYLEEHSQ